MFSVSSNETLLSLQPAVRVAMITVIRLWNSLLRRQAIFSVLSVFTERLNRREIITQMVRIIRVGMMKVKEAVVQTQST